MQFMPVATKRLKEFNEPPNFFENKPLSMEILTAIATTPTLNEALVNHKMKPIAERSNTCNRSQEKSRWQKKQLEHNANNNRTHRRSKGVQIEFKREPPPGGMFC